MIYLFLNLPDPIPLVSVSGQAFMKAPQDAQFLGQAGASLTDGPSVDAAAAPQTAPSQATQAVPNRSPQTNESPVAADDLVAAFMEMPVEGASAHQPTTLANAVLTAPSLVPEATPATNELVESFMEVPVDEASYAAGDLGLDPAAGVPAISAETLLNPPVNQPLHVLDGGASNRQRAIRAAAVASAGVVLPLASDAAAVAYTTPSATAGTHSVVLNQASRSQAIDQGAGVTPTVALGNQAAFSSGASALRSALPPMPGTQAANQVRNAVTASGQLPLVTRGADGNWSLSYHAMAGGQNPQAAVAQIAQQATQQKSACIGSECDRLEYIESQVLKASQQVETLQRDVKQFEATHGQNDMKAYQKVLGDRIQEMSRQNAQLMTGIDNTRQRIAHLKMQLVTVNADLSMAEQVLAQDTAYQTVWERLQQAEDKLVEEYSKANLDKTVLHEAYSDYEYHLQLLQRTAQESLGNYLLDPAVSAPSFIYQAPASLDIMQALVMATHSYNVQQLRQQTIGAIEQRLLARQSQLVSNWGTYESKQTELKTAQNVLDQYSQQLSSMSAKGANGETQNPVATGLDQARSSAFERARLIAPELPTGTVGKTLMGIVLAAGAIAAVAAKRQTKQKPFEVPTLEVRALPPVAAAPALSLNGLDDTEVIDIAIAESDMAAEVSFEEDLLIELMNITGQPTRVLEPAASVEAMEPDLVEADLAVEVLSRELDEMLAKASPDTGFSEEVYARQLAPVTLSLDEIDSFAEEAIRWVLQDVGLDETILEQDDATLVAAVREGAAAKQKQLMPAA